MDKAGDYTPSATESKASLNELRPPDLTNDELAKRDFDSPTAVVGATGIPNEEDDNQRAIAKAALSIAELSQSVRRCHSVYGHINIL